jgi:outer membrane lipoprotein SlyB
MFTIGFNKIAGTMKANISPEEYYSLKAEKDPYVGAVLGSLAGAAAGGLKHKSHKAALIGAGLGGAAGASVGHLSGRAGKAVRMSLLKHEIKNLKLKASPGRGDYSSDHGGEK